MSIVPTKSPKFVQMGISRLFASGHNLKELKRRQPRAKDNACKI